MWNFFKQELDDNVLNENITALKASEEYKSNIQTKLFAIKAQLTHLNVYWKNLTKTQKNELNNLGTIINECKTILSETDDFMDESCNEKNDSQLNQTIKNLKSVIADLIDKEKQAIDNLMDSNITDDLKTSINQFISRMRQENDALALFKLHCINKMLNMRNVLMIRAMSQEDKNTYYQDFKTDIRVMSPILLQLPSTLKHSIRTNALKVYDQKTPWFKAINAQMWIATGFMFLTVSTAVVQSILSLFLSAAATAFISMLGIALLTSSFVVFGTALLTGLIYLCHFCITEENFLKNSEFIKPILDNNESDFTSYDWPDADGYNLPRASFQLHTENPVDCLGIENAQINKELALVKSIIEKIDPYYVPVISEDDENLSHSASSSSSINL